MSEYLPNHELKLIQNQIRELSKINASKAVEVVIANWIAIVGLMCFASFSGTWWSWLIAFMLIPTRQHALLVLMHDAAHYRLSPSKKWNDLICNCFCAFPHFMSAQAYRLNHLAHHSYFNTEKDPDWMRKKADPRWLFPKSVFDIIYLVVADLFGRGILFGLRAVSEISNRQKTEIKSKDDKKAILTQQLVFYSVLLASLTYFHLWPLFLILWVLPFLTVFPALFRIRSMSEHFGLDSAKGFENEFAMSRNFHGAFFERFFFAPLNVGYHLDHHLFPAVPWYNLPKLHTELKKLNSYNSHPRSEASIFGMKGPAALKDFRGDTSAIKFNKSA